MTLAVVSYAIEEFGRLYYQNKVPVQILHGTFSTLNLRSEVKGSLTVIPALLLCASHV